MADQLIVYAPPGLGSEVTAGLQRLADGAWYNVATSGFEDPSGSDRTNYAIPVTEVGATGSYRRAMYAVAAGRYVIAGFRRLGATAAWTDERAVSEAAWTGTAWVTQASLAAAIAAASGTVPVEAGYCRVYGYQGDGNGRPVDGRAVSYEVAHPPQTSGSRILETDRYETSTNGDGFWVIRTAPIGAQLRIIIEEGEVDKVFTVPDQESLDFVEFLASLEAP